MSSLPLALGFLSIRLPRGLLAYRQGFLACQRLALRFQMLDKENVTLKLAESPKNSTVPARPAESLAGDIAARLEEDILRGGLRPGHRLDERELSARYGVSRTPVREALQRLSASGLAVARGRQGL